MRGIKAHGLQMTRSSGILCSGNVLIKHVTSLLSGARILIVYYECTCAVKRKVTSFINILEKRRLRSSLPLCTLNAIVCIRDLHRLKHLYTCVREKENRKGGKERQGSRWAKRNSKLDYRCPHKSVCVWKSGHVIWNVGGAIILESFIGQHLSVTMSEMS